MTSNAQCTDRQLFSCLESLEGDSALVADILTATSRYAGEAFNKTTAAFSSAVAFQSAVAVHA